jgi:large subunit ribosomal protein L30
MAAKTDGSAKLKVTQVKSTISHIARNRATVKALGLRGIGSTSVVADNDATRGMVRQVRFLVSVEEIPGDGKNAGARARAGQGDGEHESERADARERARAGGNDAPDRPDVGVEETS